RIGARASDAHETRPPDDAPVSAAPTSAPTSAPSPAPAPAPAPSSSPAIQERIVAGTEEDVLARLRQVVESNGLRVMGELHQGKALASAGLVIQSETLFVGNPEVGKRLFEIEPGAGVALPMRMNVFTDASGQTIVAYVPPSQDLAGFHNAALDQAAARLDAKLASIVSAL
ncbi:MAG: DUF302 domain-containing protein, partial [Candidatus Eisenbacteria bacterium]|nr:DUF302 domain-containing protein [Candidatus Eisenbacteria bacterium]